MKIKRRSILAGTAILSTAVLGLSVANLATNGQFFKGKVFADTDCEWMHYAGTTPTATKDALREYWICCNHHEIEYTHPESANITEATHPDGFLNEIKTANPHDERILSSYDKAFTCDQIASVASIFDDTINNWEAADNNRNFKLGPIEPWQDGVRGTWGVRALFNNNDCGICLRKDYAAQVFSNPNVKALQFDARGDYDTNNFRHREGNNSPVTYFEGATGTGLTTSWQTFSYTREMYETALANDNGSLYFVWGNLGGERYLYLDNFRPVAYDDKTTIGTSRIAFNNASFPIALANDVIVKNPYTNSGILKINSVNGDNPGIDLAELNHTIKTEGLSSFHVHKTAGSTFYVYPHENLVTASQSHGGLKFDIMCSVAVGTGNFLKYKNRTSGTQSMGVALAANKWTTVTVPFNDMRDATTYDGLFAITLNSSAFDIYLDNIRFADEDDSAVLNSFEGAQVFSNYLGTDRYFEVGKPEFYSNTVIDNTNIRDTGKAQFWVNGTNKVSNGCIDTTHTSDGAQSFRIDVETSGAVYAFYNRAICDSLLPGDKLAFDVYTDASGASFGYAPNAKRSTSTPLTKDTWTTITLTKMTSDQQFFRLNEGSLPVGSYWFDNFRTILAAPSEGMTFENGSTSRVGNEVRYTDEYGSVLKCSDDGTIFGEIGFDTNIGGNTTQVLKIDKVKTGYTSFYLPTTFVNELNDDSILSFDLYTTVAINSTDDVKNMTDGVNGKVKDVNYFHPANAWVTYTFTRDKISSDGRFLITQGSSQGLYYFDNIKILGADEAINAGSITVSAGNNLTLDTGYELHSRDSFILDGVLLNEEQVSVNGTTITLASSILTSGEHTLVVKKAKSLYCSDKYTVNFTIVVA